MGRKPQGGKAMSGAERVRRHRERLEAEKRKTWHPSQSQDAERFKHWLERTEAPGVVAFADVPLQSYATLQAERNAQANRAAWDAKKRAEAWERGAGDDLGFAYLLDLHEHGFPRDNKISEV